MRLLNVVAFSKKLRWLAQTKVITLKTQLHGKSLIKVKLKIGKNISKFIRLVDNKSTFYYYN